MGEIKVTKENLSDTTITYLQMIQATIDRMSTSSAIFKGFVASIVAGVSAISFGNINKWILLLSFIPVGCFLILDIYYLRLEKRFRFLYNRVRTGEKEVDFNLNPPKVKEILKLNEKANVRVKDCVLSPSILLFYIPMILICAVVTIMSFGGYLK